MSSSSSSLMLFVFIFIFILFCFGTVYSINDASSNTWYFSPKGSDLDGSGTWWNPWQTLARCVGASSDGDTVVAMPGNYSSWIVIQPSITIASEKGLGTVFFLKSSLNFTGKVAKVFGINFEENRATAQGQNAAIAVSAPGSTLSIYDCRFANNSYAITSPLAGSLTVIGSSFMHNSQDINGLGYVSVSSSIFETTGGINIGGSASSALFVSYSTFINIGGHSVITTYQTNVNIEKSLFNNCSSGGVGGVLYLRQGNANLTQCTFIDNYAKSYGGVGYVSSCSVSVTNSLFIHNTAFNGTTNGGVFYCSPPQNITTKGCKFINNTPGGFCDLID